MIERIEEKGLYGLWAVGFDRDGEVVSVSQKPWVMLTHMSRGASQLGVGGASPYDPAVYAAIQTVADVYPEVRSWTLDYDNSRPVWVIDYLSRGVPECEIPTVVYHGTSSVVWEKIQATGLKSRGETGTRPTYGRTSGAPAGHSDRVYLATEFALGAARFAALDAAKAHGGDPVLLAVDSAQLDSRGWEPDEDSMASDWCGSLRRMGTLAYRGTIPRSAVSLAARKKGYSWQWVRI